MNDGCSELAPLLAERALGVLDSERPLDAHVASCERCAALVRFLDDARAGAALEPAVAPSGVLDKILARVAEDERPGPKITVLRACTYCHGALERDEVVHCAACLAVYHDDCFAQHGRCGVPGCGETRVVRPTPLRRRRWPWLVAVIGVLGVGGAAALIPETQQTRRVGIAMPGSGTVPAPSTSDPRTLQVRSGQTLLVTDGDSFGTLVFDRQSTVPEQAAFRWRLRPAERGEGTTQRGRGLSGQRVRFGPFDFEWSAASDGVGYVYATETIRFCISDDRFETVDPTEPVWEYRDCFGRPWRAPGKPSDTASARKVELGDFVALRGGRDLSLVSVLGVPVDGRAQVDPADLASFGHVWGVRTIAFSADGRRVLSGGHDGTVALWELSSGRLLRTYPGGKNLNHVIFAPGDRRAIVGRQDRLEILDLETGAVDTLEKIDLEGDLDERVEAGDLAVTPDGTKLLVGGSGMDLWDLRGRKKLWTTRTAARSRLVYDGNLTIFADGERALVAGHRGLRIIDLADGRDLEKFDAQGAEPMVAGASLSPDGRRALSRPIQHQVIQLWDLPAKRIIATLDDHKAWIRDVRFFPDGRHAIAIDDEGLIVLYDLERLDQRRLVRLKGGPAKAGTMPSSLAIAPDGRTLLVGTASGVTLVFERR